MGRNNTIAFDVAILNLKQYYNEFNKLPDSKTVYNNIQIGYWLYRIRQKYVSNKLKNDEIEILLTIPEMKNFFANFANHKTDEFDEIFEMFNEFYFLKHRVPNVYESYYGKNIGNWFAQKKIEYKNNKLTNERIDKFKQLNIEFNNSSQDFLWIKEWIILIMRQFKIVKNIIVNNNKLIIEIENYEPLFIFIDSDDDVKNKIIIDTYNSFTNEENIFKLDFPFSYEKNDALFKKIITFIHKKYKCNDFIKLNNLNKMVFDEYTYQSTAKWFIAYNEVIQYKKENGKLPVSGENGKKVNIGSWLSHQRGYARNEELFPADVYRLEKIGVDFKINNSQNEYMKQFEYFLQHNNKLPTPNDNIYSWFIKYRSIYKSNNLTEKIKLFFENMENEYHLGIFDFLSFDYEEFDRNNWNNMYLILKDFELKNNFIRPVYNQNWQNVNIGSWAIRQRVNYREGKLTNEQIELLNAIKFDFSIKEQGPNWDEMFEQLSDFVKINKRMPFKNEDKLLYSWVTHQRNNIKNGKVSNEKIEKLKSINFEFDIWDKNYYKIINILERNEQLDTNMLNWYEKQIFNIEDLSSEQKEKLKNIFILKNKNTENQFIKSNNVTQILNIKVQKINIELDLNELDEKINSSTTSNADKIRYLFAKLLKKYDVKTIIQKVNEIGLNEVRKICSAEIEECWNKQNYYSSVSLINQKIYVFTGYSTRQATLRIEKLKNII